VCETDWTAITYFEELQLLLISAFHSFWPTHLPQDFGHKIFHLFVSTDVDVSNTYDCLILNIKPFQKEHDNVCLWKRSVGARAI
jgi:hypothetical protein